MKHALPLLALLDLAVLAPGGPGTLPLHALFAALGYALWLRERRGIALLPAVMGVGGPAALLLGSAIAARLPRRTARPLPLPEAESRRDWRRQGARLAAARMLDGRVLHADVDTLHSLVTVMRHGHVVERRRALETVVRSFRPALSPLIAQALTDGDQTIRALAAAASARVVQNLALARAALTAKGDRAALAELLADHARANVLLSDSQRAHLLADALALGDAASDAMRIEAAWGAGDYAAVDALVAAMPGATDPEDRTRAARDWWTGAAA
ncbi:hypothetical protein [Sphingomonas sp. VNH70]|uniref:hypothetical protein n=1 Tax=Sphingomonas silueang TaxID=3156617 RepID=UPI0032B3B751